MPARGCAYDGGVPWHAYPLSRRRLSELPLWLPAPQPHAPAVGNENAFFTPFVPLIPILGVTANIYLMVNLQASTWIRFIVWIVLGTILYAAYGVRHSRLGLLGQSATDGGHLLAGDTTDRPDAPDSPRYGRRRPPTPVALPWLIDRGLAGGGGARACALRARLAMPEQIELSAFVPATALGMDEKPPPPLDGVDKPPLSRDGSVASSIHGGSAPF